jgi:phosphoserine phosphatase RsbU/P
MEGLPAREKRLERLRMLTDVSRALTYTTSIDEVLDLAVVRAADLVGANQSLVMLTDADGLLVVRAAHGVDEASIRAFREPLAESLIARLQGLLGYPSLECFLSVPLVAQGEVMGLIAAVRAVDEPATHDDEWLLSALADQTAVALENARLSQAVSQARDEFGRATRDHDRGRAALGHELRAPLTAIQAYAALLLEGILDPITDRQREAISRIRRSGQHLLAVIENLLDMHRISIGALGVRSGDVPVAQVLGEALEMLAPVALEKEQVLPPTPASDLIVRADAGRLRQVLVNLIGNAIKYTPRQGTIQVSVTPREHDGEAWAAIAVTDNGRGIPPSTIGTLFKPYQRGDALEHEVGLGLGLFISQELVREMGGEIHVESQCGVGSTFTTLLPLAAEAPQNH